MQKSSNLNNDRALRKVRFKNNPIMMGQRKKKSTCDPYFFKFLTKNPSHASPQNIFRRTYLGGGGG